MVVHQNSTLFNRLFVRPFSFQRKTASPPLHHRIGPELLRRSGHGSGPWRSSGSAGVEYVGRWVLWVRGRAVGAGG